MGSCVARAACSNFVDVIGALVVVGTLLTMTAAFFLTKSSCAYTFPVCAFETSKSVVSQ